MRGWLLALLLGCALPVLAADTAKGPAIGDLAPTSLGVDRQGDAVDLAKYRGKVVVVSFWASWCGPCRKELPALEAIHKTYKKFDVLQVVAVNIDDDVNAYRAMVRQMKDYELLHARDRSGRVQDAYAIRAVPNLWIIDAEGRIVKRHAGYGEDSLDALVKDVQSVLIEFVKKRDAAATPAAAG